MKRLSLLALMLGFMLHAAAVGISANALVADKSIKKLYLFIVQDEHYGYVQPLDSIEVTDGKFTFHNDTLTSRLFFISPTFDLNDMEACFVPVYGQWRKPINHRKKQQGTIDGEQS